ncbi:hypothetical protein PC118_g24392, partial [Phytophthora cactorum]
TTTVVCVLLVQKKTGWHCIYKMRTSLVCQGRELLQLAGIKKLS